MIMIDDLDADMHQNRGSVKLSTGNQVNLVTEDLKSEDFRDESSTLNRMSQASQSSRKKITAASILM